MSHRSLPSTFVKTVLHNGVGRYVCQMSRVTLKFCKSQADSRGMRSLLTLNFPLQADFQFIFLATPTAPAMGFSGSARLSRVRLRLKVSGIRLGAESACTKKFGCTGM